MKAFKVTGKFKMGRDYQHFTKEVLAEDDKGAREKIFTLFGSKHSVKRPKILIEKVDAVAKDAVSDPYVRSKLGG